MAFNQVPSATNIQGIQGLKWLPPDMSDFPAPCANARTRRQWTCAMSRCPAGYIPHSTTSYQATHSNYHCRNIQVPTNQPTFPTSPPASCRVAPMPCPSFTVVWLEPRSINMPSKNSPKVNGCPSSKSSFPRRPMGDLHCLDSTWWPTSDWITLNVCKKHMSDDHTCQRNINFLCNSYLYSLLTSCVKK